MQDGKRTRRAILKFAAMAGGTVSSGENDNFPRWLFNQLEIASYKHHLVTDLVQVLLAMESDGLIELIRSEQDGRKGKICGLRMTGQADLDSVIDEGDSSETAEMWHLVASLLALIRHLENRPDVEASLRLAAEAEDRACVAESDLRQREEELDALRGQLEQQVVVVPADTSALEAEVARMNRQIEALRQALTEKTDEFREYRKKAQERYSQKASEAAIQTRLLSQYRGQMSLIPDEVWAQMSEAQVRGNKFMVAILVP